MKNSVKLLSVGAIALSSLNAAAEVRINGFASIVAGTTMDEDKSVYGYNDKFSFKPDSMFALQISSDLGEGLSATSQIVARGENDYDATFEWAYFSYALKDELQLSVGRMRIPFYRYSDYLDVGYAYTWLRPPQSVYRSLFSTFDGASLLYTHTLGDWDSSVQAVYGAYDGELGVVSDADQSNLDYLYGVNWTVSNWWLTARAIYLTADTSISTEKDPTLTGFTGLLNAIGATDAANGLLVEEDTGTFLGIGASVDYENFLIDAEFTTVEVDNSLIASQEQYYVSFAYRFEEWTPYITFGHREDTNDDDFSGGLPPAFDPGTGPIYVQATYQAILSSQESEQDIMSVGARYNFHPSAALKFDYTNRETPDDDDAVYSVGVDLVF